MLKTDALRMFTVYSNPKDFPGKFVVRGWTCVNPPVADPDPLVISDTLGAARSAIPAGLTRMDRQTADDPAIVEVWL